MEYSMRKMNKKSARPGGRELAGRKIIRCPHCREMLMDVDRDTKVELYSIPKGKRKPAICKELKQCSACGGKVGYNLKQSAQAQEKQ